MTKGGIVGRNNVFVSYSHRDDVWRQRTVTHLGVLEHQGLLQLWDDTALGAGDDWQSRIKTALSEAVVAILLVSADFLSSDFVLNEEIPALLRRHAEDGLTIVPVIVRPCPWREVRWLARMQVRPKDGRAISQGDESQVDHDLSQIAMEVLAIVRSGLESVDKGTVEPEARILLVHPILPSGCNACDAALEGDARFKPNAEYAYAVNPQVIEVRAIESKAAGWKATGVGHVQRIRCANCSMMYDAILREIPIHCASFKCPQCGGSTDMTYRVRRIETSFTTFDFEAEIECSACSARETVKHTIEKLHEVGAISVGLPRTKP